MPKFRFTPEDLLGRKQLTAGWRTLTVKELTEEVGKNDPTSTNFVLTVKVTGGEDDGVTIKQWFSTTKKPGRDLFAAFLQCFIPGGKPDMTKDYDLDKLVGLTVEGYCRYNVDRGWNESIDWRPAAKGAAK